MKKTLIVIGAGGHAKVVIELGLILGYEIIAILDDDKTKWGKKLSSITIVGGIDWLIQNYDVSKYKIIIAIGDNKARESICKKISSLIESNWATLIHPAAHVARNVRIGKGTVVCAGAVVQTGAKISNHAIINTAATIDHDCSLNNFVHVGPGATLVGGVLVAPLTFIGAGATIIPNIKIGRNTVVGAGSTVIKNVSDGDTVVGVPAKSISKYT